MTTRILAVGSYYNTALTEDLGATWQYGSIPELPGLPASDGGPDWSVVWSGSKYLAVPVSNGWNLNPAPSHVATSADGLTWVLRSLGAVTEELSNPVWTGSKFVIVGTSNAYSSADGITWTSAPLGFSVTFSDNAYWPTLTASGSRVVAVWPDSSSTIIAYSDDQGATWTTASIGVIQVNSPPSLHVDGTTIRIGFGNTTLISLDNGASWATELADIGVGAPSIYFGPLYKIGGALYSTGRGTLLGGSANEGMFSATPAASPWERFTHNLNARSISKAMPYPGGAIVAGFSADGGGVASPILARTTDGTTFSMLAHNPASLVNAQPWGQYWSDMAVYEFTPALVFEAGISDSISLSDIYGTGAQQIFAAIVSTLQLAMQVSGVAGFSAAIMDRLVVFSDGSAAYPVSASMVDALMIADGGTRGVYDLHDAINNPAQFSIDSMTGAVSIYDGYDFSSYARVGQDLYGCRADGVYRIGGNSDSGATINAGLDLGATTLGSPMGKTIGAVYMGVDTDGTVYMRAHAADSEHTYRLIKQGPVLRAILAKGVAARTWGLKFNIEGASFANLDLIEIEAGVHSRRMKR